MLKKLSLVSAAVLEGLYESVDAHLDLYLEGDFEEPAQGNGWDIRSSNVEIDSEIGTRLVRDRGPAGEVANSLVVYDCLQNMTPALARDERVWVRLCHLECLDYARFRWITGASKPSDMVRLHFFASTLPQCRDDNAIGRLWWNAHLAQIACPDDPGRALQQILRKADIRLNLIDRADTSGRAPLAQGILRKLEGEPWLDSHEQAFRDFMLAINRNGGGILFEALSDEDVDKFLNDCILLAKSGALRAAA